MKAVRISNHGGLDELVYDDIPEPDCPSDKVKILDPAYNAEVLIEDFNNINDIKMEIINKYIKIRELKKLNN